MGWGNFLSFFLTAPLPLAGKELILPKSGLPMTCWPLPSLPTNFFHPMPSFVLWKRGRSRCAAGSKLRFTPEPSGTALRAQVSAQGMEQKEQTMVKHSKQRLGKLWHDSSSDSTDSKTDITGAPSTCLRKMNLFHQGELYLPGWGLCLKPQRVLLVIQISAEPNGHRQLDKTQVK